VFLHRNMVDSKQRYAEPASVELQDYEDGTSDVVAKGGTVNDAADMYVDGEVQPNTVL